MELTLTSINLGLDVILKLVLLGILVYTVMIMKNIDEMVASAERSAESIEEASKKVAKIATFYRFMPFMGGDGKNE